MLNVNRVTIAGGLGQEPEVRNANGKDVCTISVATNEFRGKGEEREQFTEWHRVVLWGQFARFAGDYLHKGDNVYVEGRLQTRKWQDKDGNDQYTTEIVADEFQAVKRERSDGQGERADAEQGNGGRGKGRRQ